MTEIGKDAAELFGDAVITKIAKPAKVTGRDAIDKLAVVLREFGTEVRATLASMPSTFIPPSPFDATLSERIGWLDTEVLNPLERLIGALGQDNRAWFSMWPYDVVSELKPDFDHLPPALDALCSA